MNPDLQAPDPETPSPEKSILFKKQVEEAKKRMAAKKASTVSGVGAGADKQGDAQTGGSNP